MTKLEAIRQRDAEWLECDFDDCGHASPPVRDRRWLLGVVEQCLPIVRKTAGRCITSLPDTRAGCCLSCDSTLALALLTAPESE